MALRHTKRSRHKSHKRDSPLPDGFFIGVRHVDDWRNRWASMIADVANPPKPIHLRSEQ